MFKGLSSTFKTLNLPGKKSAFQCKEWRAATLLILYPDLFEIIVQSAHGSAKNFF